MEFSLRNRIIKLERENSIFLFEDYRRFVTQTLNQASSQLVVKLPCSKVNRGIFSSANLSTNVRRFWRRNSPGTRNYYNGPTAAAGPGMPSGYFLKKKKKGRSELEEKLQEVESYLDYRVVDMEEIKNLQAMLKDLETRRSASYSFVSFSLFC